MIALLLNSGLGTRMGGETRLHPKCMTEIAPGETILSWQIKLLEKAGVQEAVVTTGHLADVLRDYIARLGSPIRFHFVHNDSYRETNYIHSVHLAAAYLRGQEVLSLHGDLVLHPEVMTALAATEASAVTVDSTLPLPEKDFKGRLREGLICAVGVPLTGADCVALQPAYHLHPRETDAWLDAIAAFEAAGDTRVYAENALNAANEHAPLIPIHPLDVKGLLCAEIDNPEDWDMVRRRFATEVLIP